jgi:hypothetical protein
VHNQANILDALSNPYLSHIFQCKQLIITQICVTPSPASYNVAKTLGKDAPSASFKGSRPNSLFGGNVAVYNVFAFGTWFVLLTLGFTMD